MSVSMKAFAILISDVCGKTVDLQGYGLGIEFLRHVQRCKCLLYVIDLSVENVVDQLKDLR